jgi:1-deoxy-D-xylulose-5-phosphate synthase
LSEKFPERLFDVGIAEQHAVTFAAGLAAEGFRPIVAVYSTFLQRSYDQLCHDVCLQNLPVVFAVDRAGVVGSDGPTHHGLFDVAFLRSLPRMVIVAPKNASELTAMLDWSAEQHAPVAIRYPRGSSSGRCPEGADAPIEMGRPEIIREGDDIAIVALGPMVNAAVDAAEELERKGVSAKVVNARFAKPLDEAFYTSLAGEVKGIITIEDGIVSGGFGSAVMELLLNEAAENAGGVIRLGFPDKFIEHGPRSTLLKKYGLSPDGIINAAGRLLGEKMEARPKEGEAT